MCGVHFVTAISCAGRDDPDRRRSRFHCSNLHSGRMSSKQAAVGEIKRILFIPRRMVRRGVERVETVPFRFNIGSIGQGETHATENLNRPLKHLR